MTSQVKFPRGCIGWPSTKGVSDVFLQVEDSCAGAASGRQRCAVVGSRYPALPKHPSHAFAREGGWGD